MASRMRSNDKWKKCHGGKNLLRQRCRPLRVPPGRVAPPYWAQYSIYLPVHYRRIKSLLFWDGTPSGIFGRLKTVPLDRDNGTFNSSNTDVVEKVNFLVAA